MNINKEYRRCKRAWKWQRFCEVWDMKKEFNMKFRIFMIVLYLFFTICLVGGSIALVIIACTNPELDNNAIATDFGWVSLGLLLAVVCVVYVAINIRLVLDYKRGD